MLGGGSSCGVERKTAEEGAGPLDSEGGNGEIKEDLETAERHHVLFYKFGCLQPSVKQEHFQSNKHLNNVNIFG